MAEDQSSHQAGERQHEFHEHPHIVMDPVEGTVTLPEGFPDERPPWLLPLLASQFKRGDIEGLGLRN